MSANLSSATHPACAQRAERGPEVGLTHVALVVSDVDASLRFYARYANMHEVHRRSGRNGPIVWLSDLSRPFAIVLIQADAVGTRLDGISHLGVACESRAEVDRLCALARQEKCLALEPEDAGQPVGYRALLHDPDGHNLELSHGQEVGQAIANAS